MKTKIGIIGGGNMGGAIIAGIAQKYDVLVCEQDQNRCQMLKEKYAIAVSDLAVILEESEVIILAVKPQGFDDLLVQMRPLLRENQLVISIAAGVTCQNIEKQLNQAHVVRAMPNLPAQVGKGITGLCAGKSTLDADLDLACEIFNCIGISVVVDEKDMDALTAVSGSGPAYVFLFAQCFQKAAESLGLDQKLSKALVFQTMAGAVRLMESQEEEAGVLRARVISRGGTTQAAMDVFEGYKLEAIFVEALQAAKDRAGELSQ